MAPRGLGGGALAAGGGSRERAAEGVERDGASRGRERGWGRPGGERDRMFTPRSSLGATYCLVASYWLLLDIY